jgi:glycosyltransferase involved in cell wall biosynthesis
VRLTVAHVIAPGPVGGAESVVKALAIGRRELDGPTVVIALTDGLAPHAFVEWLRQAEVPTVEVAIRGRRYLSEIRALRDVLRDRRIDLVHAHVYHADFVAYWAARSLGLPVVATRHGETHVDLKNSIYQWMDRRLLRHFDAVICVSRDTQARLLRSGCPPGLLRVIPNGCIPQPTLARPEARARLGLPQTAQVVGWVGRLSAEKGPDLIVEAFAQVAAPGAHAVLIGEGQEKESTTQLIERLGLGARIHLAGEHPDAARLFTAFDCLAISSRAEGLPMVMWEAVAAGIPVVSFAVGGIPDALNDKSAWLVGPADTTALGAAISETLTNRQEAEQRAGQARRVMEERFGLTAWVHGIEEVYEAARLAGGSRRTRVRP